MEDKVKLLVAVGAAVTANCQPCLRTAVSQAQIAGLEKKEIVEAIQIGRLVRRGATGKIDQLATTLTGSDVGGTEKNCPFGATEKDVAEWVAQNDECGCS
jgi:AhpD family alkylhydroperoxidase